MLEQYKQLSDGEKVGVGLLAVFFGNKVLNALGRIIFFGVWLAIVIGFIGFALLMAWLTGS